MVYHHYHHHGYGRSFAQRFFNILACILIHTTSDNKKLRNNSFKSANEFFFGFTHKLLIKLASHLYHCCKLLQAQGHRSRALNEENQNLT